MRNIFDKVLREIKNNTNLDIDIYSETGDFFYSTNDKINFPNVVIDFKKNSVFTDDKNDLTVFPVVSEKTYFCVINGANELSFNYAQLIKTLLNEIILSSGTVSSQNDQIKNILLSDSSMVNVQNYIQKNSIKQNKVFVVSINVPEKGMEDIMQFLTNFSSEIGDIVVQIDETLVAYVRFLNEINDYHSPEEFVSVLNENIYEETGFRTQMGIGSVVEGFIDVQVSYKQAVGAMEMGQVMHETAFVHPFNEYIFIKMIDEIPKARLQQYLYYLLNENSIEILKDDEMLSTAETFLNNNLNLSETSRKLYMHRNTLTYRLDKLQKVMGFDIRNFSDAVTFRLVTILYRLLKGN